MFVFEVWAVNTNHYEFLTCNREAFSPIACL